MSKIRKTDFSFVERVERAIFNWVRARKHRLPFFVLLMLLLIGFSHAPYVNLFFNSYFIVFIATILTPLILDIDDKLIFLTAIVLFTVAFTMWFIDRDSAEIIINYIFIFLFSAVIKALHSSF